MKVEILGNEKRESTNYTNHCEFHINYIEFYIHF